MTPEHVQQWVKDHPISPIHVDCAVTVMLKIIDGKCKMRPTEKVVMALLYDCVKHLPGQLLPADLHPLIATARTREDDEALKNLIYEKRLMAETAISRPVMKGFKAMIREQGLLERRDVEETEA
ncbi:hypothetical protein U737_09940 [Methylomonas sp. LW13]|uniref:hypothetical protein n=1 Tax=unclassified Methylomonas TaxID=2608980 RepID=UPI00051C6D60|nr:MULTISPECIES: hypothetical protein [unclassified Methylomonas]NOV29979.1 hypothetical protein [Methylomonas sp. ZR1]PKD41494.1 hypothetical protein CWO84_05040 [Methylomonas sp. Kb3]QBC27196.1 hypothetical protein U737_09940 [Methylomonas sp. LW13]